MRRACLSRRLLTLAAVVALTLGTAALAPGGVSVSSAQTSVVPDDGHSALTFFYRQPDASRVPGIIAALEPQGTTNAQLPPILGFLAGLFTKYPEKIDIFLTPEPGPRIRRAIVLALVMADQGEKAARQAKVWGIDIDPIRNAARLSAVRLVAPGDFDLMWGASFATGEARYAEAVFDFFAAFANREDVEPEDIDTVANFRRTRNSDALKAVARKYGPDRAREMIAVGAALWSLRSNAQQHPFIQAAIEKRLEAQGASRAHRAYRLSPP